MRRISDSEQADRGRKLPVMRTPLLLLAALAALAGAAPAFAQQTTQGADLQNPANATFGCEAMPQTTDTAGNQTLVASGQPDCTWANTGGGTVPGDGTVQKITVRAGANPAQIRFVVLRTLAQPGQGQFCCYFVAETSVARPNPNTTTTFDVNLPVERNTNPQTQVISQDNVGISAISGTGTLPLFDNGRHNILDPITPEVNATFYYPRVSSARDTGSGTRADGSGNGWQVLLQTVFCPKGQEAACAGTPAGGGATPGPGGTPGGGTQLPPDIVAPTIAKPRFQPAAFRVGTEKTAVLAAVATANLTFTLNENGTAKIDIQRPLSGRKVGKSCVKPTTKNRKRKGCKRWTKIGGTITRQNLVAGPQSVRFTGRWGKTKLRKGGYRAQITATDGVGNTSKVSTASFRILG